MRFYPVTTRNLQVTEATFARHELGIRKVVTGGFLVLGTKRQVTELVTGNQLLGTQNASNQLLSRLLTPRVTSRGVYSIYTP